MLHDYAIYKITIYSDIRQKCLKQLFYVLRDQTLWQHETFATSARDKQSVNLEYFRLSVS